MPKHDYSPEWYATFLDGIAPAQTEAEVAFIARQLPRETHPRILDVCCGPGRHANALARLGYRMTGVDNNAAQIARAAAAAPENADYHTHDMRDLASLPGGYDGVINVWASFGYFDEATNERILQDIAHLLRPGGRCLVDVYNREYMVTAAATDTTERGGMTIRTKRSWSGKRMRVVLTYGTGAGDEFDWHVYTPSELQKVARAAGLQPVVTCAWFNERLPPSPEHARMQLVLQRP